nr:MAG TPA: hypothetical protein [Caudoviricetes sp.]
MPQTPSDERLFISASISVIRFSTSEISSLITGVIVAPHEQVEKS